MGGLHPKDNDWAAPFEQAGEFLLAGRSLLRGKIFLPILAI